MENGRGGEIRTHDLLYPKQARYQATLRPDPEQEKVAGVTAICNRIFAVFSPAGASQPCRKGQCSANFQSISNLLYRRAPSLRDFPTCPAIGTFPSLPIRNRRYSAAQHSRHSRSRTSRSVWSASSLLSLLALSLVVGDSKAGASSTHSKRFAQPPTPEKPRQMMQFPGMLIN